MRKADAIPILIIVFFLTIFLVLVFLVEEFTEGFGEAIRLIASSDPEILSITLRSIYISGTATVLSILWCVPIGVALGLSSFVGKRFIKGLFNALLGIPTVALGLILYLLFSSSGPLGSLNLFLNPLGVSIGQAILITPIIISFITSAVEAVDPDIKDLAKTLGASETEASFMVLKESTSGVVLAVVAGFNRAIAELGVVLMIGQNLRGRTRVLTATIALETTRGNIAVSIALAIILLTIVLSISLLTNLAQRRLK
ncbi:MAG: ABC transporter permease [Candidatus Bathyarchaeota archaeon]|nr:ABC transporter permease [Candidatus Bathyarchaeota archaeon]MDH5494566.1 ABC transporter permease [Candidatus Bathyarchaeota archaeon]